MNRKEQLHLYSLSMLYIVLSKVPNILKLVILPLGAVAMKRNGFGEMALSLVISDRNLCKLNV